MATGHLGHDACFPCFIAQDLGSVLDIFNQLATAHVGEVTLILSRARLDMAVSGWAAQLKSTHLYSVQI
jgi:hypothetical protein